MCCWMGRGLEGLGCKVTWEEWKGNKECYGAGEIKDTVGDVGADGVKAWIKKNGGPTSLSKEEE